ncbi:hypothetical protein AMECASPLE_017813 [Ameca splendens]|uniref:Uncharacterized protein n=1 Tax=Ameca splendens TaxID=208324 RepID=A0ABV0YDZ2_9TELE
MPSAHRDSCVWADNTINGKHFINSPKTPKRFTLQSSTHSCKLIVASYIVASDRSEASIVFSEDVLFIIATSGYLLCVSTTTKNIWLSSGPAQSMWILPWFFQPVP